MAIDNGVVQDTVESCRPGAKRPGVGKSSERHRLYIRLTGRTDSDYRGDTCRTLLWWKSMRAVLSQPIRVSAIVSRARRSGVKGFLDI